MSRAFASREEKITEVEQCIYRSLGAVIDAEHEQAAAELAAAIYDRFVR